MSKRMTAMNWVSDKLYSETGRTILSRLTKQILPTAFVGICAWFSGILWERAHYDPIIGNICLQRQDAADPAKLNDALDPNDPHSSK